MYILHTLTYMETSMILSALTLVMSQKIFSNDKSNSDNDNQRVFPSFQSIKSYGKEWKKEYEALQNRLKELFYTDISSKKLLIHCLLRRFGSLLNLQEIYCKFIRNLL